MRLLEDSLAVSATVFSPWAPLVTFPPNVASTLSPPGDFRGIAGPERIRHAAFGMIMITTRALSRLVLLLPILSILSACAGLGDSPRSEPNAPVAITPPAPAPVLASPPPARPAMPARKGTALANLRPEVRPSTEDRTGGSDAERPLPTVIGMSGTALADLLGPPAEDMPQPPGHIWVWQGTDCRLRVHLFPDMDGGGLRAIEYAADDQPREACLRRLLPP